MTVDISDAGILIPEGQDVYMGYGTNPDASDFFRCGTLYPAEKGRSYYSPFDVNVSQWEDLFHDESGYWMDVFLSTRLSELEADALETLGYHYIQPASGECHAGDSFPLKLVSPAGDEPYSKRWFYDGVSVPPGAVRLTTAGRHRISVAVDYGNGCTEELSLEVNVLD